MKNFKNKLIVLIVIASFLQSCSEYVEEANPNEASSDTYWVDLDQSDASLTGVYGGMLDTFIVNPWAESWRSDLGIVSALRTGNPNARVVPIYTHTYNSGSFNIHRQWNALYQVIYRANQLITGLENMDVTLKSNTRWTEQMGQARLLRGMCHFYLHAIYNKGEIIIRDKVPGIIEEFNKSTSSSAEVITFFRDDLLYAYNNLPHSFDEKSRVDKGVAATILGTSHLYEKEYGLAIGYFNEIINNQAAYGYALLTGEDVKKMYTEAGAFNSESIFEINYSLAQKIEESQWYEESFSNRNARYSAPNGTGGGAPEHTVAAAWLTEAYSTESLDPLDPRNTVVGHNGRDRVADNISLRASSMIALVNDEHTEYYQSSTAAIRESFNKQKISFFKQHTNHDIAVHEKDTGVSPWKSGKNVTINRLADIYLMRAECYLEDGGNVTAALSDINTIRARWGLALLGPVVDGSKTYIANESVTGLPFTDENTLRKQLRHVERPLELNVQGVSSRNIDLRRWGNAQARFAELAGIKYYLDKYTYVNATGANKVRNNSLLTRTVTTKELYASGKNEFEDAAANYSDLNDYLPIPLTETDYNSNVN
ncbi:MAG: RagB/SusD family nutrient uptake outer membrane protein [Polaribacter sp.]